MKNQGHRGLEKQTKLKDLNVRKGTRPYCTLSGNHIETQSFGFRRST